MLTEVLRNAPLTHLVQLQSQHIKRNLPHDTAWLTGLTGDQAPSTFMHMKLYGADCTNVQPAGAPPNGNAWSGRLPVPPGDLPACTSCCLCVYPPSSKNST